jgi:hypothetical protein
MKSTLRTFSTVFLGALLTCGAALAQVQSSSTGVAQPGASVAAVSASPVPSLVNYSGVLKDSNGRPVASITGVTFLIYKDPQGGAPVWMETQNVTPDKAGRYTVQLGSSSSSGLPSEVFMTGEARWLGVQTAGEAEQPRVLLVAVPYAMKAGDAATIGGLPPSAFVLATPPSGGASAYAAGAAMGSNATPPTGTDVTGLGTTNYIPLWTSTSNIANSVLFQSGSGSTAKIGIGNTTPASTLDVTGTATIRGLLNLPAAAAATAAAGADSRPFGLVAATYNSSSKVAANQVFHWQAEPTGNNTATPSATLNLLFATAPATAAETGLKINSKGQITFAAGQAFPGVGTIKGITTATGSGLTGGGANGTLSLGLLNTCTTKQVLQWNGTAWACASAGAGTVTSVASGAGLTGGPITGTGTLSIATGGVTNAMLASSYAQLGAANTFATSQSVHGTLFATSSSLGVQATTTSVNGVGINALSSATTGIGAGVIGASNSPIGYGVEGQNNAITGNAVGVFGVTGSTSGVGVEGSSTATTGLTVGVGGVTSSPAGYGTYGLNRSLTGSAVGVYGTTASSTGYGVEGAVDSPNGVAVYGTNTSSTGNAFGVYGSSASANGFGVEGTAPVGVYGVDSLGSAIGVLGQTNSGSGLQGQASSGKAVVGLSGTGEGVYGQTTSPTVSAVVGSNFATTGAAPGVYGSSSSSSGYGVEGASAATTGSAVGVYGTTASSGGSGVEGDGPTGVFGVDTSGSGTGVWGTSGNGIGVTGNGFNGVVGSGQVGVIGQASGTSSTGTEATEFPGVWGDTGGAEGKVVGVFASADSNTALLAVNSDSTGDFPAMVVQNDTTATHNPVFQTSSPGTYSGSRHCTIDTSANLTCTGVLSGSIQGDAGRQTAVYAMQSAENWLEDAGSGQLSNGSARIELDPAFARTVNAGIDYHVFLTPKGDCKGLYVTNETATGFEVRELSGGTSSIAFDYRIMAKRKGYENVRLEDLTERFKQRAIAPHERRAPLRSPSLSKPQSVPTMATPPMHPLVAPRPVPVAPKLLPITPPRIAQAAKSAVPQAQK